MSSSAELQLLLPDWAVVQPERRAHIARVVELVAQWADAHGLAQSKKDRWIAAARLHDALRDAKPFELRKEAPPEFKDWPDLLLHGPVCASRLRNLGFVDEGILKAITYHTVGHPGLDDAGRALFLADFLEPGRNFDPIGRAAWRARMPHDMSNVLREVVAARVHHMISSYRPLRSETIAFWNALTAQ